MFISNAYAQGAAAADPGVMGAISGFAPFILVIVAMYFIMIRPQQKKMKEQRDMIAALAKGDEVVTIGGILGKVTKVDEAHVTLDVGKGVEITVQKQAVTSPLPKGTVK